MPNSTTDLRYYWHDQPGIRRVRRGRGFSYVTPDGSVLADDAEKQRIKRLGIPPAYRNVWICPDPQGHLQAMGQDARGRRQYIYHPDWMGERARLKFEGLADFGRALPTLRRRVLRDLRHPDADEGLALAAVVALLDQLALRVGNTSYARANGSYGLTTLRRRHVHLSRGAIRLEFSGKGGKTAQYKLKDRLIHAALQKMDDLPGGRVFSWLDAQGQPRGVLSQHVNAYLADVTGLDNATAKTFRTWSGTLDAFRLALATPADDRLTLREMTAAAADRLHNTPSVARSSYIHPRVLELADSPAREALKDLSPYRQPGLRQGEGHLIAFLLG